MAHTYTVHLPPEGAPRTLEGADSLVLVKDGMIWTALFLPWLWMMVNRMWLPLLGYLIAVLALDAALRAVGATQGIEAICVGLLTLFVALEAGALRRWSLRRRGWRLLGVVTGPDLESCEAKAIDGWLSGRLVDRGDDIEIQRGAPADEPDVIGLFPEPERGR